MKKYLPYILAVLLGGSILSLFLTGNNKKERKLNERITLRKQDKIPYGTYVAYKGLDRIFPKATIYHNRHEPGFWDSLSSHEPGQALIIITSTFNADETEMEKLISFIEKGNDVFVSARTISYAAAEKMQCQVKSVAISSYPGIEDEETDSLHVLLTDPPFPAKTSYTYPGKRMDANFFEMDETITEILGEDEQGRPNFIRLRAGKGNLFMHLAPLAFTNYFLLHKNNIGYYEKALSVINPGVNKVMWDEYYLHKKNLDDTGDDKKSWFSVLSRYPALKAALLTAMFTLLVYVLLEMRRKQRYIPRIRKPANDSLDFVKTIGRLYFDKGDHKNLSRKMSAYFLEHVRTTYKLPTGRLDENFIRNLQHKSGVAESGIRGIISFIKYLDDTPAIDQKQLINFHKELESFYQRA